MISAYAHTNIALIKYMGKSDTTSNLPATGSLSLTLDCFGTKTSVKLIDGPKDLFTLEGELVKDHQYQQVTRFIDHVRALANSSQHCEIISRNDVPTASGLASSASGFAALALAASSAYGLRLSQAELSALARLGSGSAARSIFGGFSYIPSPPYTKECYALPLEAHLSLDVSMLVVQCSDRQKSLSSREAMLITKNTSPFYPAWVKTHPQDLTAAIHAVQSGDFTLLGETMEHSTLKMHATLLAAQPGVWYLKPTTLAIMDRVRELRRQNIEAYFTMDAGPHVKILCKAPMAKQLLNEFKNLGTVSIAKAGPAAHLVTKVTP